LHVITLTLRESGLKSDILLKQTSYYLYPQGQASISAHTESMTHKTTVCGTGFKLECVSCNC